MFARRLGLAALTTLALACGGGGGGGGNPAAPPAAPSGGGSATSGVADAQAVLADAQMTAAVSALGAAVALNQVDPASFPDPAPGLTTAVSGGGPAGGLLRLDFGAGLLINNTLYTGVYLLEYAPDSSGSPVNLSLIPSGLDPGTASQNSARASGRVEGSIGMILAINNTTATAVLGGAYFLGPRNSARFSNSDSSLTLSYDGASGIATFNGSLAIDDPILGPWSAAFTDLGQAIAAPNQTINSGRIDLSNGPNGITASFAFDTPNAGQLTLQPAGISLRFQL